jgi:hypothetical protein
VDDEDWHEDFFEVKRDFSIESEPIEKKEATQKKGIAPRVTIKKEFVPRYIVTSDSLITVYSGDSLSNARLVAIERSRRNRECIYTIEKWSEEKRLSFKEVYKLGELI